MAPIGRGLRGTKNLNVKTCPWCGSAVSPAEIVCRTCGARLPLTDDAPGSQPPAAAREQRAPQQPTVPRPSPSPPQPTAWPGYPQYPQGYGAAGPAYGAAHPYQPYQFYQPYQPYSPYSYWYGNPYAYPAYFHPYPVKPPRAPGETFALVISWIVTVFGGVSVLCGIAAGLILVLVLALIGGNSLGLQASVADFALAPLVGGAFALYFGIRGILRKPSPRFSLPNPILFAGLAVVVWIVAIVIWQVVPTPGPAAATLPLLILSGILPAFTILAFTAWRLRMPSTQRHVWMSLLYGMTLAPLLAIVLEGFALVVLANIFGSNAAAAADPSNISPSNPVGVFVLLLTISVAAPVFEEGLKPLGAVFIMRRLRTPASAFLMGLAAGIGFDVFETIGYIGSGEADWVNVSIERLGAGLLHGVGAGMAALGWYYLINGKGVRLRWLRGFGGIAYAVAQHAIFNGSNLIGLAPGPVGQWLSQPWYIGQLPFDHAAFLFFVYYAIIFAVLVFVTGRLVPGPLPREIVPAIAVAPAGGQSPFPSDPRATGTSIAATTSEGAHTPLGSGSR